MVSSSVVIHHVDKKSLLYMNKRSRSRSLDANSSVDVYKLLILSDQPNYFQLKMLQQILTFKSPQLASV